MTNALGWLFVIALGRAAPASEAPTPHRVRVQGKKAKKIVILFGEAGALEREENRLSGAVEVNCRLPGGDNSERGLVCRVRPIGPAASEVELPRGKARRWVALLSAVDGFDAHPGACGPEHCDLSGRVALACTFAPGPNLDVSYACEVSQPPAS